MENVVQQLRETIRQAGDLAETKAEILKLKVAQKVAQSVSALIAVIALATLTGIAFVILSIGAAYWIGSLLKNTSYGFFCIGGFYLVAGLFVYLFRKKLISSPVSNLVIDRLTN
jgi:Putative Actinobacterial Holin-X, holin superfamily III